jgi:hypothetical protein
MLGSCTTHDQQISAGEPELYLAVVDLSAPRVRRGVS